MLDTLQFGPYAKDIKLNLSAVLADDPSSELNPAQSFGIALACAYATQHPPLIQALLSAAHTKLSAAEIEAAKSAATIMAMNNIYYRFVHLANDPEFHSLPARLRMTVIGNPGIDRKDYELYCLAVSAINGCGLCMESHSKKLVQEGLSRVSIQSAIRIAAVVHATQQALSIAALD